MGWYRACSKKELELNRCMELLVANRIIAIFEVGGAVHAVDGICAHQGGPIAKGRVDGSCVTCPWHGWQYDVTSGRNLLTGKHLLEYFPTEHRNGEVWINVPLPA